MAVMAETIRLSGSPSEGDTEDPREHLMHDPRPRGEMNAMVLESMHYHRPELLGGDRHPGMTVLV